jgi:hypothetical protein
MRTEHGSTRPDPVIEAYKKDIDRTLLRENLKLSVEDRLRQLMELQKFAEELRNAGRSARRAAGRIKDLEAIAELEALREERDPQG